VKIRDELKTTELASHIKALIWLIVILVGCTGLIFFTYRVRQGLNPPEYEGKVVDKWAGYNHTEEGSFPYFRLSVEISNGQRLTVAVDKETYERAKVGMWIRKNRSGIELTAQGAGTDPLPDLRTGFEQKVTGRFGADRWNL
jgi:hypothetical protein